MHDHHQVGRTLDCRDAKRTHLGRQPWLCLRNTVLHELLRLVRIGAKPEGDGERQHTVGGRLARHVEHVFDAVDLLFERCGNRLGDDGRIGAGIGGADHDRRWHHFGIFRDRQGAQADQAGDQDQDRQNACKDGSVDEETGDIHGGRPSRR